MKKIITLMACLVCVCAAQGQRLTFKHDGMPIENGAVVYCSSYNELIAQFGQLTYKPELTLSSSQEATVNVELKSLESDEKWGLCSLLPSGCKNTLATENYVATKSGTISSDDLNLQIEYIHGRLETGAIVTRKAEVSAWVEGKEEEKISFTLVVTNDEVLLGIQGTVVKENVQVVDRTLEYTFESNGTRMLTIYGLDGQKVLSQPFETAQGKVSLEALSKGVYVYQISGGATSLSRKVILK